MEQTITINVPEGKIAKYNETTQTIEFFDKEPIRSKSWEEFCKNHEVSEKEYYISSDSRIIKCGRDLRNCFYNNNLGSKEDAEGILALIQLTRLHDEWVGDWKPNWENDNPDVKFEIYSYNNVINIFTSTKSYRFLAFPSFPMAKEFLDCFRDLIEKARKFI